MMKKFLIKKLLILALALLLTGCSSGYAHNSVKGLGQPIQKKASGQIKLELDDYEFVISKLYSYDITALVLSTHNYNGFSVDDKLSPRDFALVWGKLAEINDQHDFHWSQSGRWYHWKMDSWDEANAIGGTQVVSYNSANNHIIPADETVRTLIKTVKVGECVHMKGYLVNIDGMKSDGRDFHWHSSTTREDSGGGSCEVFYVESIEWK